MDESILLKIGLTGNESKIYMILLEMGEAIASDLAKKTDISRPHVYDSINRLMEKGLCSYVIKNNKKYFKAASPKEIINYLDEEKDKISDKQKEIRGILPELLRIHSERKAKTSVEVFEGKEGLKTVLMDIVNYGEDFVAFGATENFPKVFPLFSEIFVKRRQQKDIKAKIVVVKGEKPIKTKLNSYRWIPKEYGLPSSTIIYGDKTAILLWTGIGIIIKSREVADSYRSYFKLLWKIGKK